MNDITTSGVFYLGNSVTDKPTGTGSGTGGMMIQAFASSSNLVRLFVKNASATHIWVSGVSGGAAWAWVQLV